MQKKRKQGLHERILNAAQKLFYENGYIATSVQEIAKEAGTSVSGMVRLFDNKYGVLASLYDRSWEKVMAQISKGLKTCSDDPRERILSIAKDIWSMYDNSKDSMYIIVFNTGVADTLILNEPRSKKDSKENLKYLNIVVDLCNECVKRGLVDKIYTTQALREAIYGLIEGVLLGWYQQDWAKGSDVYPDRISIDDGIIVLRLLLYGKL